MVIRAQLYLNIKLLCHKLSVFYDAHQKTSIKDHPLDFPVYQIDDANITIGDLRRAKEIMKLFVELEKTTESEESDGRNV